MTLPESLMFVAQSPADLPKADDILSRSGLEFMQAILEGEFAGAPIAETVGITLTSVEDGRVIFSGTPQFEHCNPVGAVHGGWYGTLLDSALGCAAMT